jgi:hypothetical protein
MTISSTTRIAGPFLSGTALPYTFKVFAAADLNVVRLNTSTGVETSLVLGSDYTVALNGNQNTNPGGTVNLTVAASATSTVTITSDIANLQPTDLTNQGGFYPEVITDALDRATIQIQQMSEDVGRSLKGPISDGNLNMELPTAAQRANSFLAFDANGVPTAVVSGSSGAPTTITRQVFSGTGSQTVFTLASDPGALGNSAQVYIGGVYQQRSTYTIGGTTLTFSSAPVAGTDNIEFVNFLTSNIGATSADLVTYTPSGTGAVARSAASKMGDVISVKDFGAVGDGVADDRAAIQTAMTAAMTAGKTLYFPSGIYAMSSTGGTASRQIAFTLNGNLRLVGDSATIKCTASSHRSHMFYLTAAGYDFSMEGITLDANNVCLVGIRIDEGAAQGTNDIALTNCAFVNSYGIVGGVDGYVANNGATILGGYRFVNITNCIVSDHNRAVGAGTPGSAGTSGIGVGILSTYYPQNVNVSGCLFQEIKNNETTASANNVDCDGIVITGGNTTGTTYIPATATISNNSFVNCKGRSIKVQNDESVIVNNTVRFAMLPITGGSGGIINCQIAAGDVSHNVWHFDVAPGNLNPFDPAGTLGTVGGSCIALYPSSAHSRPRSVTAIGNVAFNNVPEATGVLGNMLVMGESASSAYPVFQSLKDNRLCGGAVQDFANISLRGAGEGEMYLTICDNHASKMTRSFMSNSSSGTYDKNFIVATGNVNWTATPVRHLINTSSPTSYYPAKIIAFGNVNIGLAERTDKAQATAFVPRFGDVAPSDSSDGGMYSVQAVVVADDAEYSFPAKGYLPNGSSLRFISSNFDGTTNFLFSQGTNTITSISAGTNVSFANTTNPDVDTDLNVWIASDLIRIKNRLGSSRVFTLFSMG